MILVEKLSFYKTHVSDIIYLSKSYFSRVRENTIYLFDPFLIFMIFSILKIAYFFQTNYIENSFIFLWPLLKDSSQSLILILRKLLVEILSLYKVLVSDIILISQKIVFQRPKHGPFFYFIHFLIIFYLSYFFTFFLTNLH